MTKKLLSIVALLVFCRITAFSQEVPKLAPVNPAFTNYLNGTSIRGAVPSPLMPVKSSQKTAARTQVLPSHYDMREHNWVSPVKNQLSQGGCGSCWTFACMANLEALNLKQDSISYNFSEDNLNNCHAPFDALHCKGGSFYISSAYLLRGSGPLLESQDPYSGPNDSTCSSTPLKPAEYITDSWFIPANDHNAIKQAIMDYGSLDVSFYFTFNAIRQSDSTFFFTKKYTNTTPASSIDTSNFGQWHEVSLIGWDDNKVTAAGQPGAWIIKNSIVQSYYGDTTQSAGNLYVSYDDSVAWQSVGCWPKKIPYDSTTIIHNYDDAGWVSSFGFNNGGANYAIIKFDAAEDEKIKMLSAVAANPNTTLSFEVYSSFNGTTLSGLLGSIAPQVCTYSGYHSFNLANPIGIPKGQSYYVKVKYECASLPQYLIPIEMAYPGYTTAASIESGKCWVSGNDISWSAIGSNTSSPYDLCIKSYATKEAVTSVHNLDRAPVKSIYPNPATTKLNIQFSDNSGKTIFIKNQQGQLVITKQVNTADASIDVSQLAAGIYFISIQSDRSVQTLKFIRQE